jgi:hypothetical protein
MVSSAVVVSSDSGTVYLDQSGVALAELLPGTVSIPVSGTGEGTVVIEILTGCTLLKMQNIKALLRCNFSCNLQRNSAFKTCN